MVSSPIQNNNITSVHNTLNPLKVSYSYSTQPVLTNSLRRNYSFYPLVSSPVQNYNVNSVSNPLKRSFSYTSYPLISNSLRKSFNTVHPLVLSPVASYNRISLNPLKKSSTLAFHPVLSYPLKRSYNNASHHSSASGINSIPVPLNSINNTYAYHPMISSSIQKNYDVTHPFVSNPLITYNTFSVPTNIITISQNVYHPTITSSLRRVYYVSRPLATNTKPKYNISSIRSNNSNSLRVIYSTNSNRSSSSYNSAQSGNVYKPRLYKANSLAHKF